MNIEVFTSVTFGKASEMQEALHLINDLQRSFRLVSAHPPWLSEIDSGQWLDPADIFAVQKAVTNPVCVIVESTLVDDIFSDCTPSTYLFTTSDWISKYSPPSLTMYIVYMLACGLPSLACALGEEASIALEHRTQTGCIFDYCGDKSSIKYSMMRGEICQECQVTLRKHGLERHYIDAVQKILALVKKQMIAYRQRIKLLSPDSEIRKRLIDHEDQFTERKRKGVSREDICKTLVAFANSVPTGKEAILFIGVSDEGEITGVDNTDGQQKEIRTLVEQRCFPPIPVEIEVLNDSGVLFLAVIVKFSDLRPHCVGPAYIRRGSESVKASVSDFAEITSRLAPK